MPGAFAAFFCNLYIAKGIDFYKSLETEGIVMNGNFMNRIVNALDLPQDVVLNIPRITLTGKIAVFLENHKGIVEYSERVIRVNTPIGIIVIKGEDLLIKTIIADEITIDGNIKSVEYEE